MSDEAYRRYVHVNLPHARTIASRLGRTLEALGAFGETGNGSALALLAAYDALEAAVKDFDEDPPLEDALRAADEVAERRTRARGGHPRHLLPRRPPRPVRAQPVRVSRPG